MDAFGCFMFLMFAVVYGAVLWVAWPAIRQEIAAAYARMRGKAVDRD